MLSAALLLTTTLMVGCATGPSKTRHLAPYTQHIADTTLSFDMVPVQGGTIEVLTESGPQTVSVEPFWIATVETTWELYDAYRLRMDRRLGAEGSAADAVTRPSMPYGPPDRGFGYEGYPAISISYLGAESFCHWLSLKTGTTYRLPTEAEWRLACSLGKVDGADIDQLAWHAGNAGFQPRPVGTKLPNKIGVFDMKGNIAEWCVGLGGERLVMGGSFRDQPEALGCASRVPESPRWNESDPQVPRGQWWLADADFIGFRVVCEP